MRDSHPILSRLGRGVRELREREKLTLRTLAERSGISERFLSDVEHGKANLSMERLFALAEALQVRPSALVEAAERVDTSSTKRVVSLIGLRGAGKSTVGAKLAARFHIPFVELDEQISQASGMTLAMLFEIHGEAYFRNVERAALRELIERDSPMIIATGGSLVTDPLTFAYLREHTHTVWLRATPQDHWDRVLDQGDARPMKGRRNAKNELRALLARRSSLYARAEMTVDTSLVPLDDTLSILGRQFSDHVGAKKH